MIGFLAMVMVAIVLLLVTFVGRTPDLSQQIAQAIDATATAAEVARFETLSAEATNTAIHLSRISTDTAISNFTKEASVLATNEAKNQALTQTALAPTLTPTATRVPSLTFTPRPTLTPVPTATRLPTITPSPTVVPQTQQLGPIWDTLYDESYTVEVTVENVRFSRGQGYSTPKTGMIYVIVDLNVRNIGPGSVRGIGVFDFQVKDGNGAFRDYDYIQETWDCSLDMVDLAVGGRVSGCIGFEVPETGSLELIYAPYKYEGLQEGRYLSFLLRR